MHLCCFCFQICIETVSGNREKLSPGPPQGRPGSGQARIRMRGESQSRKRFTELLPFGCLLGENVYGFFYVFFEKQKH